MVVRTLEAQDDETLVAAGDGPAPDPDPSGLFLVCAAHLNNHIGQMSYLVQALKTTTGEPTDMVNRQMPARINLMSYSVKLTEQVVRKLNGYRLSKREVREIRRGLHALTTNPRLRLIRVGPPHDKLQYDLVITDAGEPRARRPLFLHGPLRCRRRDALRRGLRTYRRISCSIIRVGPRWSGTRCEP